MRLELAQRLVTPSVTNRLSASRFQVSISSWRISIPLELKQESINLLSFFSMLNWDGGQPWYLLSPAASKAW